MDSLQKTGHASQQAVDPEHAPRDRQVSGGPVPGKPGCATGP